MGLRQVRSGTLISRGTRIRSVIDRMVMCVWSEKPRKRESTLRQGVFSLFWTVIDSGHIVIHLRPPCCTAIVVTLLRPSCLIIPGFGFERTFDARIRFNDSLTRTDRVDQEDRVPPATSKKETEGAKRRHLFRM